MQIGNDKPERDRFFILRQCLNVAFMLGAVAGVSCYIWGDKTTGLYIVLGAMAVKMAESMMRVIKL